MADWLETNRAWWDERVPLHMAGEFYDLDGFLKGRSDLRDFEREELGDVRGATLFHPQCHIGTDTLSWAREGARVTGLDFSAPAVSAARELAAGIGIENARFIEGSVYDAPEVVRGKRFDVVYTGLGAINWLPDIERWARTMAELVEPDGRFYLVEFHPISNVFADDTLELDEPYFHSGPFHWHDSGSYGDPSAETEHNDTTEWNHGLGEVVTALIGAGLEIELLSEHDFTVFPRWPFLERVEHGVYRMPASMPSLPLMYSLLARRRPRPRPRQR